MNAYNILIVSLIVFTTFLSSTAAQQEDTEKTLKLQVLPFSNSHFIALITTDGAWDTAAIDIKESGLGWTAMFRDRKYGYWTYSAADLNTGLQFPLSFKLTASTTAQVTLEDATITSVDGNVIYDTKTQYAAVKQALPIITNAFSTVVNGRVTPAPTGAPVVVDPTSAPTTTPVIGVNPTVSPVVDPTAAPVDPTAAPVDPTAAPVDPTAAPVAPTAAPVDPTVAPTAAPVNPTEAPVVVNPTAAPTVKPDAPTAAPVPATQAPTQNPTQAPTQNPTQNPTQAPTQRPPTAAPTTAPTTPPTQAPVAPTTAPTIRATAAPTQAPAGACSVKPKIMVPLYVYPGAAWDALIAGSAHATTVAIINPYNGPRNPPNADYVKYMKKMHDAGVDMIGYVYTLYGNRDINVVKADINVYATQYPYLKGIFLDEAAADAGKLPYYKALYDYIMGMPGWTFDVVNPGVIPDAGYLQASTQIVTLENYGSEVASHPVPSYGSCNNKEKFVAIVHTVNKDNMQSVISAINNKKYFGYIYITDGPGGCCTYNWLATYYADQARYIGTL